MKQLFFNLTAKTSIFFKVFVAVMIFNIQSVHSRATGMEDELVMEQWMVAPFEVYDVFEEGCVEQWMSAPFEVMQMEETLDLEQWMRISFETVSLEEMVNLERWMMIPFEPSTTREQVVMEAWMVRPFTSQLAGGTAENEQSGADSQL